jgi:hypothetical protein
MEGEASVSQEDKRAESRAGGAHRRKLQGRYPRPLCRLEYIPSARELPLRLYVGRLGLQRERRDLGKGRGVSWISSAP